MSLRLLRFAAVATLVLGACSSDDEGEEPSDPNGTGGAAAGGRMSTGGKPGADAGNSATGGANAGNTNRGGSPAEGGANAAGRSAQGGDSTPGGEGGAFVGGAPGDAGAENGGTPGSAGGSAGKAGEGGAAGAPSTEPPSGCDADAVTPSDFETVYEVGPGRDYATPSDVPWESLEPGTLVLIHARAEAYRDKWVLNARGTEQAPIVVRGVPDGDALPVISGADAVTRSELDFWNEERGLVKIGGANVPDAGAAYLRLECLDLQTARPGSSFTDTSGGTLEYAENAACVYIEEGSHISVKNNLIHGCGNGIFASSGSSDLLISGNYVYDNGNEGSIYEHNSYTEANGIVFEFNHYGRLCEGCDGNNLKDRSAGLVVRYNWIEHGNRQLDLVESDHDEIASLPSYRSTFVYGNVLFEPEGAGNSQIVHYGGDGDDEALYRKGTLYFHHNTVISRRLGNTTLFRLSTEDESADVRNNVVWPEAGGDRLAISSGAGSITLERNWLPTGWVDSHDTLTGSIEEIDLIEGTYPNFVDATIQNFELGASSACVDAGVALASGATLHGPLFEYVRHQSGRPRVAAGLADLGAFEFQP